MIVVSIQLKYKTEHFHIKFCLQIISHIFSIWNVHNMLHSIARAIFQWFHQLPNRFHRKLSIFLIVFSKCAHCICNLEALLYKFDMYHRYTHHLFRWWWWWWDELQFFYFTIFQQLVEAIFFCSSFISVSKLNFHHQECAIKWWREGETAAQQQHTKPKSK